MTALNETQQRILAASEHEFAKSGFAGASIRAITKRAGVNIAAVNYHFGSKQDLFFQMVKRRIEPINAARIAALDGALERSPGTPLPLETVVGYLVRPMLAQLINPRDGSYHFLRAMGRGLTEQVEFMNEIHTAVLSDVVKRFAEQIARSLGEPAFPAMAYGMHLLSCVIVGSMMQHQRLHDISRGKISLEDVESHTQYLVAFICGGLRSVAASSAAP